MDAPVKFKINNESDDKSYEIVSWVNSEDCLCVVVKDDEDETRVVLPEDLTPVDASKPNYAQILKMASDAVLFELTQIRPNNNRHFINMLESVSLNECQQDNSRFGTVNRKYRPLREVVRGRSLEDYEESERTKRMCEIACDRDALQFKFVPERFRTDEAEAAFLAKRKQVREEEAAQATAKAAEDAARAKRKEQYEARKEKKKQKLKAAEEEE